MLNQLPPGRELQLQSVAFARADRLEDHLAGCCSGGVHCEWFYWQSWDRRDQLDLTLFREEASFFSRLSCIELFNTASRNHWKFFWSYYSELILLGTSEDTIIDLFVIELSFAAEVSYV